MNDPFDDYDELQSSNLTRDDYDELQSSNLTRNNAGGQTPGEMLREARRAHDYSVEDLCAQTKLSARTVNALEDNDFEALSQPVFARGYYRQCAKVLNIDSDRLLAAYAAAGGESAPRAASPHAMSVVPEDVTPSGGRRSLGLFVAVVVLLVAVGAAFLLMPSADSPAANSAGSNNTLIVSGNDSKTSGASGDTSSVDNSDPIPPDTASQAGQQAPTLGQEMKTERGAGIRPADSASAPQPSGADNVSGQRMGGRNVNDSLGGHTDNSPSQTHSQTDNETDSDSAGSPETPAAPRVDPNHLAVEFSNRSWVDVRDAKGKRLLTGIFEAGEKRQFDGTPPYKIALGRANAVDISIGGQGVDLAPHTASNGTARLTVSARNN